MKHVHATSIRLSSSVHNGDHIHHVTLLTLTLHQHCVTSPMDIREGDLCSVPEWLRAEMAQPVEPADYYDVTALDWPASALLL